MVSFSLTQTDQWDNRFQELFHFRLRYGHCLVPHNEAEYPGLHQWVKRQRSQFKRKIDGKHTTLTDSRQAALDDLGFVWDSHRATWEEKFDQLRLYKEFYGDCNVPTSYPENPQLSIWVKCQRRQYRLFVKNKGKDANITPERILKLNSIGFVWNPRRLQI